jgi:hypothetical protein
MAARSRGFTVLARPVFGEALDRAFDALEKSLPAKAPAGALNRPFRRAPRCRKMRCRPAGGTSPDAAAGQKPASPRENLRIFHQTHLGRPPKWLLNFPPRFRARARLSFSPPSPNPLSTLLQRFAFARLSQSYLSESCSDFSATPCLLDTAACGGLRSTPNCRPGRTYLHLSYSHAAPWGPALLDQSGGRPAIS